MPKGALPRVDSHRIDLLERGRKAVRMPGTRPLEPIHLYKQDSETRVAA